MGEIKYNGRTYSGLIQANGCFVDTDNVIVPQTSYNSTMSYTATQDCAVTINFCGDGGGSGWIYLDGEVIGRVYTSSGSDINCNTYFVRKGQTISASSRTISGSDMSYTVYGLMQGSPITFLSEYASACYDTNEREVGCWVDGKPLYQKTLKYTVTSPINSNTVLGSISDIDMVASIEGIAHYEGYGRGWLLPLSMSGYSSNISYNNGDIILNITNDTYGVDWVFYVTVQYTKTTDTAGSGQFAPTGAPTHHYSTNEQIVGTWIDGKPLYERVFTGLSIALNGNDWVYFNDPTDIENVIDFKAFADNSGRLLNCAITEYQRSNTNGIMFSGITGFDRTVNVIVARFTKTTD